MKDFSFGNAVNTLGLTAAVDVFDDEALFQPLNNEDVLGLSQLGGADGFSGTAAILRSTGISQRRVLRAGVAPIDLAIAVCRKLEQWRSAARPGGWCVRTSRRPHVGQTGFSPQQHFCVQPRMLRLPEVND